jgi:hypothetical protein
MGYFYLDNAITWAQFRIRGGWRSALAITGTFALGVVLCITIFFQMQDTSLEKMRILESFSIIMLTAQIIVLTMVASNSIGQAIRRDRIGLQIESHRLMPLPAVQVVAGYLAGGAAQMVMLAAVFFVVGIVLSLMRGVPAQSWVIANGTVLAFAVSVWSIMALSAFVSRGIYWSVLGIFIVATFSNGNLVFLVPAILAYCTPMQGQTVYAMQAPSVTLAGPSGLLAGLAAQAIIFILCLRAAARKYARDDAVALTPASSMAIFAVWSVLSWFGISHFEAIKPSYSFLDQQDWTPMVVASLCASLIVGMLPIASVALQSIARNQRRLAGENVAHRPWLFPACLLLCIGFTLVILATRVTYIQQVYRPPAITLRNPMARTYFWPNSFRSVKLHTNPVKTAKAAFQIAIAAAIFYLQMAVLMRMLYPFVKRANVLFGFVIAVLWFAPLLADVWYYDYYIADSNVPPQLDRLAVCSPVGTFLQAVRAPLPDAWRGLGMQFLALALFFALLQFQQSRVRQHRQTREARLPSPPPIFPESSPAA